MALGSIPGVQVDAPAAAPRRTGILAAATVLDNLPAHAGAGISWESDLVGTVRYVSDLDSASAKTLDGVVVNRTGPSFYVYATASIGRLGSTDPVAKATARLEALETVAVEEAVRTLVFVAGATKIQAAATTLRNGVAALEEALAGTYGGLPMLHMDARMTTVAMASYEQLLVRMIDRVETGIGTPVSVGAGYTAGQGVTVDGTAAGAGEWWVFGSGQTTLHRGPIVTTEVFTQSTNQRLVLAERIYAAQVDGPLLASLVNEPTEPS